MRRWQWLLTVVLMALMLAGCATGRRGSTSFGRATGKGLKPPNKVAPCCKALAEGSITLAQCMQNPACKANGNVCCMRAIEDLPR